MMSEGTVMTEANFYDYESGDDEYSEAVNPPWVDRVKLRHGMDWLDLITNEVNRDTARVNSEIHNLSRSVVLDQGL